MMFTLSFIVFLLLPAVWGDDECEENDELKLFQRGASLVHDTSRELATSARILPSIFCWVVEGPGTGPLVQLVVEQMAGCDDYLVFSNYSSHEKMVALYEDDMVIEKVNGWLNNTRLFAKAYAYLSKSTVCDNFDWIVKVDGDTFFRPGALPGLLAEFDPNDAIAISSFWLIEGALEVVSRGVFRRYGDEALFTDSLDVSMFEDRWLDWAVRHMGGKVVELPLTECLSLVLNGYNINGDIVNTDHNLSALVKHFDGFKRTWHPDLFKEDFGTTAPCVRRDIVALHPVKNVTFYREFQRLTKS